MKRKSMMRTLTVTLGFVVFAAGIAFSTPDSGTSVPPEEALQKLMDGNRNYVENKLTIAATSDAAARMALASPRNRTPSSLPVPTPGFRLKLFSIKDWVRFLWSVSPETYRIQIVLGSIEYAAEHLGSSLIMVLGHERCGAVTATVDAKGKSTGSANIDAIVKGIKPNVNLAAETALPAKGSKNAPKRIKANLSNA